MSRSASKPWSYGGWQLCSKQMIVSQAHPVLDSAVVASVGNMHSFLC